MGLDNMGSEQNVPITLGKTLVAHMTADGKSVRVMKEKIASIIGIDKWDFDKILNDERGITDDQAEKLGHWFKNGKEFWMDLQRKRPHQEPGVQPRTFVSKQIPTVPLPIPAPILKAPEDDPALWPHAEYAVRLLRDDRMVIELEPDLIMGGEVKSNWQKDLNDPYSGELFRRLHIVYIKVHSDGSVTPLKGKAVIFQRPNKNSGNGASAA